jgi:hypothetical protein
MSCDTPGSLIWVTLPGWYVLCAQGTKQQLQPQQQQQRRFGDIGSWLYKADVSMLSGGGALDSDAQATADGENSLQGRFIVHHISHRGGTAYVKTGCE